MQLSTRETLELRQLPGKNRCVLIVDDEPAIRDLCATALGSYRTLKAADGDEALHIIERENVDVILTDVMMPRINGLELLKTVKEREPNKIVVIMTGYTDREIILRALKSDADDFISKPINLLQLRTTVDKVLEKKALKEELLHLKGMDRLKSDFLGLVSHKLKTPITAISLFIQNLARGIGDTDEPAFQKTLALILEESKYLGHLIQDLLFYSDAILQDAPLKMAPTDLRDIVSDVLMQLRDAAGRKDVTLINALENEPIPLQADRQQIHFVVRALIDNAIKFTPADGTVTLTASWNSDRVRLIVNDTGPGITRENLTKVFEKFYQVDPDNTGQVRGFGLGLFYSRQFVAAHEGTISLDSRPGLGTMATVTLPR